MNTSTQNIARIYGNHNQMSVALRYFRKTNNANNANNVNNDDDDDCYPFTPILYRSYASSGPNDINSQQLNLKSRHKSLLNKTLNEMIQLNLQEQQQQVIGN